ncbi:unnamed protein product [Clonostachys rosea f. rosea IK726]|uniref:Uncharacterized protein n=1 Tax=Clonostachys rosea f. rosea IK726 TaxID=1349383 RepID=A0ACA9UEH7_BIOOC|nr:unnamed protein product [Clonostachys rosea f. rosea IK726]
MAIATLSHDISPLPLATEIPPDNFPQLVHSCANVSAVWVFGNVVLKIKRFQNRKGGTRENVTLDWLANQNLKFAIPRALHYSEDEDRSYLFSTRLPGITLNSAWPLMNADYRQYYVQQVAEICTQLSSHSSTRIGGVDNSQLCDSWLEPFTYDFRPEALLENSPGNILVDPREKKIMGIIDWEMAGFVPREWISTKFAVGWGLDLEVGDVSGIAEEDWRKRVHQELKRTGFPDVSDTWKEWFNERYASQQ